MSNYLLLIGLTQYVNMVSVEQVLVGHTDHVTCAAVAITNKSIVASGSRDSNVIIWDMETGSDEHTLQGHLGYVTNVKLTGDGTVAVSGILLIL